MHRVTPRISVDETPTRRSSSVKRPTLLVRDFDDILDHVGGYGRYQKLLILLALPFNIVFTCVYLGQVFIALTPDHWCHVPELQGLDPEARRNISAPIESQDGVLKFSQCYMYDVNYTEILKSGISPNSSWPTVPCRYGWDYDLVHDYATITSELDWVCSEAWKPNTAQSIFFVGSMIGGIIFGYLGDRYGRLPVLIATNILALVAGVGTAFAKDFGWFVFARFIMGLTYNNCFLMMYIIMLEYVSAEKRSMVANLPIALFLTLGLVSLPWVAYAIWNWQILSIVTSLPMATAIFAPWIIPESGRWLLSKGRVEKAEKILRKAAKINGVEVEEKYFEDFRIFAKDFQESVKQERKKNFLDLFRTPVLRRRVILLTLVWMIMTVCYDGHIRNLTNLDFNLYVIFSITGSLEFPADMLTIFSLETLGRKWTNSLTLLLSGVFYLIILAVPMDNQLIVAILAGGGRFCVTMAMNTELQYSVELLPTELRGQGVNFVNIAGHLATVAAPLIVYLGTVSVILPFLVLGLLGAVGAIVGLGLPETANQNLPQTAEEAENFGHNQPFFPIPCLQSSKTKDQTSEGTVNRAFTEDDTSKHKTRKNSTKTDGDASSISCDQSDVITKL